VKNRYLIVSDLQIPFEARYALKFCLAVQKDFNIPPENIYCVGDEVDQYFGSLYQKSVDGHYTAAQEIKASHQKLKAWYKAFPSMKIATSNHGMRWAKKAAAAEIPSQMLKTYQEVLEAPKGWVWKDSWVINAGLRKIKLIHGLGYGGMYAYRTAPLDQGMSTVFGHLHANAGIAHINTASQKIYGMNVGCLIDTEAYAFNYGKDNRFKPWLGCGVIVDDGLTPMLIPYGVYF
jgi:hypothetical protein